MGHEEIMCSLKANSQDLKSMCLMTFKDRSVDVVDWRGQKVLFSKISAVDLIVLSHLSEM